jgi:hypothetical protein
VSPELKNRILCSRPMLALHVLMGKPVCYRMHITGPLDLTIPSNKSARIVHCNINYPTWAENNRHDRT